MFVFKPAYAAIVPVCDGVQRGARGRPELALEGRQERHHDERTERLAVAVGADYTVEQRLAYLKYMTHQTLTVPGTWVTRVKRSPPPSPS